MDPAARLYRAVYGLMRAKPALSAGMPVRRWQIAAVLIVLSAVASALFAPSTPSAVVLTTVMAVPFAFVVVLRLLALFWAEPADPPGMPAGLPDAGLPTYSVLVPLFREAGVVRQLVQGIARLDYPCDRLEVLFILESIDAETAAAFAEVKLAPHMRIVTVPDGAPRTKPRALNYALTEATGDYVVVYDAEDLPEQGQLKQAIAAFRAGPANLGCLQARLNVYNPKAGWLATQFAIEYSALFDRLLPALERLGLPVLLGGTSNHFPRRVLDGVGGWDPFNVTEDADLGIRLARLGWHVGVLRSTTWEEAPPCWPVWLKQRTRWLKGWMQTWLVHMREPRALWRTFGAWRFAGFQLLMGALLLSALVHPWFFVLCLPRLLETWLLGGTMPYAEQVLWGVVAFNLVAGYVAAIVLGQRSVARRHASLAMRSCLLMPFYWLAISIAAYRALGQLVRAPHLWEKTDHAGLGPEPGSGERGHR
jgi:cellulose synthase/poly-beta-1,6-N-acetylglucosamine synthase-like glycosyltransferase